MSKQFRPHPDAAPAAKWMEHVFGMSLQTYLRLAQSGPLHLHATQAARVVFGGKTHRLLEGWRQADRKSPAGARPEISDASLVALLLVQGFIDGNFLINRMAETLEYLDPADRLLIGIKALPSDPYQAIARAIQRLHTLVNPYTGPRWERLNRAEIAAIIAARDPKEFRTKLKRLFVLTNTLITDSGLGRIPEDLRARMANADGRMNVAVDATFLRLSGINGIAPRRNPGGIHSVNYDTGLYRREGDHDGTKKSRHERPSGIEVAIMTSLRTDPSKAEIRDREEHREARAKWRADHRRLGWDKATARRHKPKRKVAPLKGLNLIIAMDHHKPGKLRGSAWRMVEWVLKVGVRINYFITDRAYLPGSRVADLQLPLLQIGARLVMKYKRNQMGILAHFKNLVLILGSWYPDFMPEDLINAEILYQDAIQAATQEPESTTRSRLRREARTQLWQRRAERSKYRLIPRGRPHPDGSRQFFYPDFGFLGIIYDHRTNEIVQAPAGKTILIPAYIESPGRAASKNALRAVKFEQTEECFSTIWDILTGMRQTVESQNSSVKAPQFTGLGDPMKRLVRGPAFAIIVAAVSLAVLNQRRMLSYFQKRLAVKEVDSKNRRLPSTYGVHSWDDPADDQQTAA